MKKTIILFIVLFIMAFSACCENFLSLPESPVDYTGQIDTIVDIDGNNCKTVGIGTQIWKVENLRTTGLLCPGGWHVPANSEWSTLSIFPGGFGKSYGWTNSPGNNFLTTYRSIP